MLNHYIYKSYEVGGREYIGSRSCNCLPESDIKYFGSFKDKTFNPTEKTILFVCETRKEALEIEIELHDFFDVAVNPQFANLVKQTSTGFSTAGLIGENYPNYGKTWWKNELSLEQRKCIEKPEGEGWELGVLQKTKDKKSGEFNHMFGRTGKLHPMFGRTGEKNSTFGTTQWKNEELQEQKMCVKKPEGDGWEQGILNKTVVKNRAANSGERNPMYGITGEFNHSSKAIIAVKPDGTELHFGSGHEAAKELGINQCKLSSVYLKTGKPLSKGKFKNWRFRFKFSQG